MSTDAANDIIDILAAAFEAASIEVAAMTPKAKPQRIRCIAVVWQRDTSRVSRDKNRFRMNYSKKQCSRAAVGEAKLCRQHLTRPGTAILEPAWHEYV